MADVKKKKPANKKRSKRKAADPKPKTKPVKKPAAKKKAAPKKSKDCRPKGKVTVTKAKKPDPVVGKPATKSQPKPSPKPGIAHKAPPKKEKKMDLKPTNNKMLIAAIAFIAAATIVYAVSNKGDGDTTPPPAESSE